MLEEVTGSGTKPGGLGGGPGPQCGCGREEEPRPRERGCQRLCLCPLAATSRRLTGSSPVVLGALRVTGGGPGWGLHLVWRPCPAPAASLTWALTRAPALDLLADGAGWSRPESVPLGSPGHAVDGDVQRLGCQKPQLSFVSILHTCCRVEERVSPPAPLLLCSQDHWAPAGHPVGRGLFS